MSSPFAAFLGTGLVTPFQRDVKNDFANDSGLNLIKSCVGQILGTRARNGTTKGEIEWRSDFGSLVFTMLHRKGRLLNELARVYVTDALAKWEPRVQVATVQLFWTPTKNLFVIGLRYDVIDRNVPGNNVIYPGVEQDILLPVGPPQAS